MKKTLNNTTKNIFMTILFLLTSLTSFLMMSESQKFYNEFLNCSWKSWLTAGLLEAMVITFAAIKIGDEKFQKKMKVIMVCAFTGLVVSAGMQSIIPALEILDSDSKAIVHNNELKESERAKNERMSKLLNLSEDYMDMMKDSSKFSQKYKQKQNNALNSKRVSSAFNKIATIMEKDMKATHKVEKKETQSFTLFGINMTLINIFILFALRVFLQVSALFCSMCLGKVWRMKSVEDIKIPGVNENKSTGKYTAFYKKHLGTFENKIDAIITRVQAEKKAGIDLSTSIGFKYLKDNKLI